MNGTEQRKSNSPGLALLLAVLVLLPVVYVVTYFALHGTENILQTVRTENGLEVHAVPRHHYRFGEGYVNALFWPAEKLHERWAPEVRKSEIKAWSVVEEDSNTGVKVRLSNNP